MAFWKRQHSRNDRLEHAILCQLEEIVRKAGAKDGFQLGYLTALVHTWEASDLPPTAVTIAARALIHAHYSTEAA